MDTPASFKKTWFANKGAGIACVLLLSAHAALAFVSVREHSPTVDEGSHILSGLLAWTDGRLDVYRVNPPLVKLLFSIPVVLSRPKLSSSVEWVVPANRTSQQQRFVQDNQNRYMELVFRARCVLVGLSVLGGWIVYRWSTQLFGPVSGMVGLGLWTFCPNILGWAGVCTVDLGATVFAIAAVYALRYYFHHSGWLASIWAGALLGLAVLSKFTLLVLYPIYVFAWILFSWNSQKVVGSSGVKIAVLHLMLLFGVSVLVVNMGYGFQGTGLELGSFHFHCWALTRKIEDMPVNRFASTWLEHVPIPLPAEFVRGLDEQKAQAEHDTPGYLGGQFAQGGRWYFYLYALAVKLPLGTLLLVALVIALACVSPRYRASSIDECLLGLPVAAVILLISSQMRDQYASVRYILPAFPFLFIAISRVGLVLETGWKIARESAWTGWHTLQALAGSALVLGALALNGFSAVRIHPHYLSYFNEIAGGPNQGWEHLIESNTDWGQDLLFLKRWVDDHPEARPLQLAFYGGIDPHLVGLNYELAPFGPGSTEALPSSLCLGPRSGWYAVSVNLVCGLPCSGYDESGARVSFPAGVYTYFQFLNPVAKAGYSIFIYRITNEDANQLREQLGLAPVEPGVHQVQSNEGR